MKIINVIFYILFCFPIIWVTPSSASFFNPDLDIDIDDSDMARIEGWIKEFPEDIRNQMEKLFFSILNSKDVAKKSKKVLNAVSGELQCVNNRLIDGLGNVLSDTVLGKQKYSRSCIHSIGERANMFFAQNFNELQRYQLEKCTLREFANKNSNKKKFIRNTRAKSQSLKTMGAVINCSGNKIKDPFIFFLEGSEYFNAFDYLVKNNIKCKSLKQCNDVLKKMVNSQLNDFGTKWPKSNDFNNFSKDFKELFSEKHSEKKKELWKLYELYNLLRSLKIKRELFSTTNGSFNNKMLNACNYAKAKNTSKAFTLSSVINKEYASFIKLNGEGALLNETKIYHLKFYKNLKYFAHRYGRCGGTNEYIFDCNNKRHFYNQIQDEICGNTCC